MILKNKGIMKRNTLIYTEKTLFEVENAINKIYRFLREQNSYNSYGVLNGLSSVILFFAEMYRFYRKEEILNDLNNKIEILLSNISPEIGPTLCSGQAGICWLLRYLDSKEIIDCDDIDNILNDIDKYIYYLFVHSFINDVDYLHGGLGIAYYYLLANNKHSSSVGKMFLNKLIETKINFDDGSCAWKTQVKDSRKDKYVTVANFSLSHGMAAIIVFLAKYFELTKDIEALNLIKQTFLFFRNNVNPDNYYSVYSNWIDFETPDERCESRLAWCYGDLGIALALRYAGTILNDSVMLGFSDFVAKKTTQRFSTSQIVDVTFCHGSSGASFMYNYLYKRLGDKLYRESAMFWLNDTLNRVNSINLENKKINTDQINNEETFLTGLPGVGLALLSLIDKDYTSWSEILLLN